MLTDRAKEIVSQTDEKMQEALNFLEEDLKTYRVGKANPAIFNGVTIDKFGKLRCGPLFVRVVDTGLRFYQRPFSEIRTESGDGRQNISLSHIQHCRRFDAHDIHVISEQYLVTRTDLHFSKHFMRR